MTLTRTSFALASTVLVGVVVALAALPRAAEHAVRSELRARGFANAELSVRGIGWGSIELADVRLAPDLRADRVRVELDVARGAIEAIDLDRVRAEVDPDAIEASSLARLLRSSGAPAAEPPARVRLERARLHVAGLEPIEVDGTIRPRDGDAQLVTRSPFGVHRVRARAREDALSVDARSALDRATVRARWTRSGTLAVDARAELGAGERPRGVRLGSARLVARATLRDGRVEALELRAGATGISVDGLVIGDAELAAHREGSAVGWRARVDGPSGLTLAMRGRAPLELARIAEHGPVAWELAGPVDGALVERALPGVVVGPSLHVALTGTLRVGPSALELEDVGGTVEVARIEVPDGDTSVGELRARVAARATILPRPSIVLGEGTSVRAGALDIDELHARGVELAPELTIDATDAGVRIALAHDAVAHMERLSIGSGRSALHFDETRMSLGAAEGAPIVDTARDPHVRIRLDARARRVAGLLRGVGARGSGQLSVTLRRGGADIELPLEVEARRLEQTDADLALERARVALPLRWERGELASEGSMRAGAMAFRAIVLGPAAGAVRITPDAVRLAWRAPATPRTSFRMHARLPFDEGSGTVDVIVPRADAAAGDPLTRVLAELTGFAITGTLEGEAHLDVDAPERGRARLVLQNADVVAVSGSGEARGVNGTLLLSRLRPLETAAPSPLSWTALRIGDLVHTDAGTARLGFDGGRIEVAAFDARAWGGRARAAPFAFDWDEPDLALDLQFDGIEIDPIVRTWSEGRARATGRLDGRVALRVQLGERRRVILGPGRLDARGPGRLRIGEGAARGLGAAKGLEGLLDGEWLRRRLESTLSDFRYERLVILLDESEGTTRLRARVVGRGVRTPQELDLALNVRGIQPLVDGVLRTWPNGGVRVRIEMERR